MSTVREVLPAVGTPWIHPWGAVRTLFVNDVEQSVIDFFMGEDEFRACYILDVEELKM